MKSLLTRWIILLIPVIFLLGCSKDPSHSIRIKNLYSINMSEVKVNSTSYGKVNTGATTDYKPVNEGSFTISGSTTTGLPLNGSGSVTGKGSHKWTLTITNAGGISIVEDK